MQISIQEVLKNRIQASSNGTLEKELIDNAKEYNKKWADAVEYFREKINKERIKENLTPFSFIVIRQKLAGVKNIEDLRWFYFQCLSYQRKKKENTFSKCFFGALKLK